MTPDDTLAVLLRAGFSHAELGLSRPSLTARPVPVRGREMAA